MALGGAVAPWQPMVCCALGMWVSDFAVYALARYGGGAALRSPWGQKVFPLEKSAQAAGWFRGRGGIALVFSRFVLGTRTALLVAAGALRYPAGRFLAVTAVAAASWCALIFGLFRWLGTGTGAALFGLRWTVALAVFVAGGTWFASRRARVPKL